MNAKIPILALSVIALALLVSGCVSDNAPADSGAQDSGPDAQSLTAGQEQTVDDVISDIIGENDTIEIGEMI
jgi:PBP1b-binding outer membrane lipoprotein LpoB